MKKIKVCAIVGVTHDNSNTVYFVSRFINILKREIKCDVEYQSYNLNECGILNCIGCYECLKMRECILEDSMEKLKRAMVESDIILWATPAYMNGVSGIMKIFVDRLHSWTKLFYLRGKYGIVLSTSSHKVYDLYVKDYLGWIQISLGLINIGAYNMCVDAPAELYSEDSDSIIQQYVRQTIINYKTNYCKASQIHETMFEKLRDKIIALRRKNPNSELVKYWENSKLIDCEKFQIFLDSKTQE